MEDEYLDILDDVGKTTGKACLKSEAHQKGYFHATVHVWFYTKQGNILLQKRGANKQTYPNFWDVSVAGHVMAGEPIEAAALREVKEEIGLKINTNQLTKIDVRKNINRFPNGIKDCEFQNVFLVELLVAMEDLTIQTEEVDAIRLFTLKEFKDCITNPKSTYKIVPSDMSYYHFVMERITNAI